jgi:hypothetical protein
MRQGARTDLSPIGETSQADAAKLLNVGKRSVERAVDVRDKAVPELVEKVERGEVSVSAAASVAKLPKQEQKAVASAGAKAIAEKASELRAAKKKADAKLATLPSPAEALERSKEEKAWVKGNDGEMHLFVDPKETEKYDVWLEIKPHVMALAEPVHSAETFAASVDDFWLPRIPTHIDAAISYLAEVKRLLEDGYGRTPQIAAE